jgi:S1/P1 Nuclease
VATNHDDDGRSMTFQAGCIWADESRRDTFKGTYEYHYINVPQGSTTLDLTRDCAALDCAVVGIQRFARYVALTPSPSSSREKERRVLGLRFLGHFVGDLHQPLHVGFAGNLGGNLIDVQWDTGPTNVPRKLHMVWDSSILQRAGVTSQADGTALNAEITPAELTAWQNFDIASWAEESFALALSHAYRQPNGDAVADGSVLGDDYFNAARPVVIERLKRAGVRLAHLINAAAASTLPVNMLQLTAP